MTSGAKLFYYDGFTFAKSKYNLGRKTIRWYCSSRSRQDCKASLESKGNTVVISMCIHNHDPPRLFIDENDSRKRNSGSWVWKYFMKLSPGRYRCNECGNTLSLKNPHNYNNLNRHFRLLHGIVYDKETEISIRSKAVKIIKREVTKLRKRRLSTWAWKYFEKLNAFKYVCDLCGAILTIKNRKHYNNMNRHFVLIHPEVFDKETEKIMVATSAKILNRDEPKCNTKSLFSPDTVVQHTLATEDYKNPDEDMTYSSVLHKGTIPREHRSWILKYYEMIGPLRYRCILCKKNLSGKYISNLHKHIGIKHPSYYKTIHNRHRRAKDDKDRTIIRRFKQETISNTEYDNEDQLTQCEDDQDPLNTEVVTAVAHLQTDDFDKTRAVMSGVFSDSENYEVEALEEQNFSTDEEQQELFEMENMSIDDANRESDVTEINEDEEDCYKDRSWIWNFYIKINSYQCLCSVCNKVLITQNPNNLKRHIKCLHPTSYKEMLMKKKALSRNTDVDEVKLNSEILGISDGEQGFCNIAEVVSISDRQTDDADKNEEDSSDFNWIWLVIDSSRGDVYSCRICEYTFVKLEEKVKNIEIIRDHLCAEHGLLSAIQINVQHGEE